MLDLDDYRDILARDVRIPKMIAPCTYSVVWIIIMHSVPCDAFHGSSLALEVIATLL